MLGGIYLWWTDWAQTRLQDCDLEQKIITESLTV